jgi:hypothetical protein
MDLCNNWRSRGGHYSCCSFYVDDEKTESLNSIAEVRGLSRTPAPTKNIQNNASMAKIGKRVDHIFYIINLNNKINS